jgi:threonine dehydrogenase-like Zn-dependent dehydrogenase
MGAHLMGAGQIIAVESRPERQELAKRFGADVVVDFTAGDPVEQIMDLTGGQGVDAAIEAFGFPQTFEACVRVTKAAVACRTSATTARTRARCSCRSTPWGSG